MSNQTPLVCKEWNTLNDHSINVSSYRDDYNKYNQLIRTVLLGTGSCLTSKEGSKGVGYAIPNFHRRVNSGCLLPHTSWRKFLISGNSSGVYNTRYTNSDGSYSIYRVSPEWEGYDTWVITEAECEAYVPEYISYAQAAAAKLMSSGFDALTFLAEAREIPHLFVGTAKKLLRLDLPKKWRFLANDWLSYRYGWRTLVYDLKNLSNAIRHYNDLVSRSRFSASTGSSSTSQSNPVITNNFSGYYYTTQVDIDASVSIRGSVTADISLRPFQFNPLITAWELIPYSFVVDWFLKVGQSLSALTFLCANTNYVASSGFKVTVDKSTLLGVTWTDSHRSGTVTQSGSCHAELEVRTPCLVPLHPYLTLNLNSFKIVDLMAMLVQKYRR